MALWCIDWPMPALQNRHDADDIFQEVFLRYVRRGPVFASYEHGKAWFLRALP